MSSETHRPERFRKTLGNNCKIYSKYPIIVILTPQNQTDPEKVAQILANAKKKIPNLSACFMGGEKIEKAKKMLEKNNIATFENPERVLAVIEKLSKYQEKRNRRIEISSSEIDQKTGTFFQKALAEKEKCFFGKKRKNCLQNTK